MDEKELRNLFIRMRDAQCDYFKHRGKKRMEFSMKLERLVDIELGRIPSPENTNQPTLFN